MTPKFSVGEVVILQSHSRPECNGEYTIILSVAPGEDFIDPHYGGEWSNGSSEIGYFLDDPRLTSSKTPEISSAQWRAASLRKKHQPGELSYTQLLESLTTKQGAPA